MKTRAERVAPTKRIALGKLSWGKGAYTVFALCTTTSIALPAQTLTVLYDFCSQRNCLDGANPYGGLVQATNESLYGTTAQGGANGKGTIFEITTSGEWSPGTKLLRFDATTR
jgi:uncharacterized repeat protein (TIGR03803 family)